MRARRQAILGRMTRFTRTLVVLAAALAATAFAQPLSNVGFVDSQYLLTIHPAYQQIIGMGPAVVPLLLRELEREVDHWFWALKAITGADPVPPASRGKVREMAEAWLRWGREQGLHK